MTTIDFSTVAERSTGWTHMFKIPVADLNGTAAASKTINLLTLEAGDLVRLASYYLPTPFDGGATSAMVLDVGWDTATGTDDDDGLIDNLSVHADGTPILAADGNGAAFATLRTGFAAVEAATVQAKFTATGGNLTLLTQGEVWIYLNVSKLAKLK